MRLSANVVQVPFEHLKRYVFQTEGKPWPGSHFERSIDIRPMLSKGGTKKTDRSENPMSLAGPSKPATVRGRGAQGILRGEGVVRAGPKGPLLGISNNVMRDEGSRPGMLGRNPSEELATSYKDLKARLGGGSASCQVQGEQVAAIMAVVADSLGNGNGEPGKLAFSRWGDFASIQGSGKHKGLDDSELRHSVPGHPLDEVAEGDSLDDPTIQRASIQQGPCIELSTQVPD